MEYFNSKHFIGVVIIVLLLVALWPKEKNRLESLINKNQMTNKIFLKGYSKDIFFFMKKAEAFVLSSLWEDPGFVIIEAALSNLSIISSNCKNGPLEFLLKGEAGILFENNKENELKLETTL